MKQHLPVIVLTGQYSTKRNFQKNLCHMHARLCGTPVYLGFLQVAKKNLQFALHGPKLSAMLEACNRGTGTKEIFLSCVSYCQNICSN